MDVKYGHRQFSESSYQTVNLQALPGVAAGPNPDPAASMPSTPRAPTPAEASSEAGSYDSEPATGVMLPCWRGRHLSMLAVACNPVPAAHI